MVLKTLIISTIIREKNRGDIQDILFTRKTENGDFREGTTPIPGKKRL